MSVCTLPAGMQRTKAVAVIVSLRDESFFRCVIWINAVFLFSYLMKWSNIHSQIHCEAILPQMSRPADVISCLSPLTSSLPLPLRSQLRDEELSKESQESNWFSAPSALRVYGEKTSVCVNVRFPVSHVMFTMLNEPIE